MTQAMGSKAQLGYMIETTLGVLPATPALKLLYFNKEGFQEKVATATSAVIRSNRNPTMPTRQNRDVTGSFETELAPSIGTLLRAALGSYTAPGGSAPYTHVIKVGDLPSLIFEKGFTDLTQYLLYLGCKVNKVSLSAKLGGNQTVSFDLMGLYEAQALKYKTQTGNFAVGNTVIGGTSTHSGVIKGDNDATATGVLAVMGATGAFQDAEALTDGATGAAVADGILGASPIDSSYTDPGHTPWDGLSIATVEEGGSPIAYLTGVDLTIENNLDGGNYCIGGGGVRRSLPEGKVKVSGTITALFESMALYRKAVAFQETSLKIIWQFGTGAGSAGNESLEILLPEIKFSQETPIVEGDKGILYKGPFEAYYNDSAQASSIQITLKNTEAAL